MLGYSLVVGVLGRQCGRRAFVVSTAGGRRGCSTVCGASGARLGRVGCVVDGFDGAGAAGPAAVLLQRLNVILCVVHGRPLVVLINGCPFLLVGLNNFLFCELICELDVFV